jgi:hypothetical protein
MIKLSTAQIANHLTQSTWTRQAMHFVFLQHLHLEKRFRSTWCLSNRRRNLLAHLTHGNGKGKGKGRKGNRNRIVNSNLATSEPPPTPEPAEDIRLAIQAALPDAARLCMQSELVASEWDVPTYPHQSLNKQDGISLVPKRELPGVISRIGFTANKFKVAILISEHPNNVGLLGYHWQHVRLNILALNSKGVKVQTSVMRCLVQLGFGPHVQQVMQGPQADMFFTVKKMTCRFPEALGWPAGPLPASLIMAEMEKHVPSEAISDIQPRQGDSATFYIHSDYIDTILRSSGQSSVFIKETSPTVECHLLWLDEEVTLSEALTLAASDGCLGIARKGGAAHPKLALRFRDPAALTSCATANKIRDVSKYSRWKITGIDIQVGTYGLLGFLTSRGFEDVEVLYLKDSTGVFLTMKPRNVNPGFYMCQGVRRQFTFKALNALARDQVKLANQQMPSDVSQASGALRGDQREARQQAFFTQIQKSLPKTSASSPAKEATKQKPSAHTGETPDAKKQRDS